MQAVELPLVEAGEDGLVYLLMPGFEEGVFQGIQFEVFEEEGILNVYCYESGFEEREDCEGVVYPIALDERDLGAVENLETLRIVDPEDLDDTEDLPDEDRAVIEERFENFRAS